MPLPRYSASTENALFLPKIGEFWRQIFTTALKSITYPKINLECKYERLNACHCVDIVQIPKTHFFTPKLVILTQNCYHRPEINNLPKDPSWVQIWTSECMPLRRYSVNTKNALFQPKIGKFWPKIFTNARKSITCPKIHLGCKYELLNACHCADIVWIPKTYFFTPKSINFHPKLCQNRTNKIAKVTLGHRKWLLAVT